MTDQLWIWIGFGVFVLAMLALDLGVFRRKSHTVGINEALTWSGAGVPERVGAAGVPVGRLWLSFGS